MPESAEDLSSLRLSALTAEYVTLRDEIGRLQNHEKDILNFLILVVGGMFVLAGRLFERGDATEGQALVLLLFPPLFFLLSVFHVDRTARIILAGDYITNTLAPAAQDIVGSRVWRWDVDARESPVWRQVKRFDYGRWAAFPVASLIAVGLYLLIAPCWFPNGWANRILLLAAVFLVVATFAINALLDKQIEDRGSQT